MMEGKLLVSIYRSPKRDETYLYVRRGADLESLPDGLLQSFGKPEHAMDLLLTPTKNLARADAKKVMDEVEERGFYIQLPPPKETPDLHA